MYQLRFALRASLRDTPLRSAKEKMKIIALALLMTPLILGATTGPTIEDDLDEADYVVVGVLKEANERFHYHTARGNQRDSIQHYLGGRIFVFIHVEEWNFRIPPTYERKFTFPKIESSSSIQPDKVGLVKIIYPERYRDSPVVKEDTLWVWILKRNPFSSEYVARPMDLVEGHQREQIEEFLTKAKENLRQNNSIEEQPIQPPRD